MKYSDLVDYSKLDPVKRAAIECFSGLNKKPERLGFRIVAETLGEPAIAIGLPEQDFMLAFNVEGLGTKNLIADSMSADPRGKGIKYYESVGKDCLAMSTNDLAAIGADAFVYGDILSSGDSNWFGDLEKSKSVLKGFKEGAEEIGLAIPCGETPTLKGVVNDSTIDMAGASLGIIRPRENLVYGQNLSAGDVIIGLESSGIHSNGVSLARKVAESLKDGYFSELPSGAMLGEELLKPTVLYTRALMELLEESEVHYLSPITGHGWKKIMRARKQLSYEIANVPEPGELFDFLVEKSGVSQKEAYFTWNMGLGYAVIAPSDSRDAIFSVAEKHGIGAFKLGSVAKGSKRVSIKPKGIVFE
jgi:phosphoribosylformylglycinamidine cyclo-ligase